MVWNAVNIEQEFRGISKRLVPDIHPTLFYGKIVRCACAMYNILMVDVKIIGNFIFKQSGTN